jgi:hypothetical protein
MGVISDFQKVSLLNRLDDMLDSDVVLPEWKDAISSVIVVINKTNKIAYDKALLLNEVKARRNLHSILKERLLHNQSIIEDLEKRYDALSGNQ